MVQLFPDKLNAYYDVRYNKLIVIHCVKIGTKIKIIMPQILKIEIIEILKQ